MALLCVFYSSFHLTAVFPCEPGAANFRSGSPPSSVQEENRWGLVELDLLCTGTDILPVTNYQLVSKH